MHVCSFPFSMRYDPYKAHIRQNNSTGHTERKKKEEVDRRRGKKSILKSRQGKTTAARDRIMWRGIVL